MGGQIFISYRREDTEGYTGRLYDRLHGRFPQNKIFIDVDSIEPGVDFVKAIEASVASCDVLVAVIGKRWLTVSEGRRRRLDNPQDYVRLEIGTALQRGIRVIPVLVEGALMPQSDQLPDDLKALTRRNALNVSHDRFLADAERLTTAVERALEDARVELQRPEEEKERLPAPAEAVIPPPPSAESRAGAGERSARRRKIPLVGIAVTALGLALLGLFFRQSSIMVRTPAAAPLSSPREPVVKSGVVEPALVGSWESLGQVQTLTVHVEFVFNAEGTFSRRYSVDEAGVIEAEHGKYKVTGSKIAPYSGGTYTFQGTDTMEWVWGDPTPLAAPVVLTRVGKCEYPEDLFVGKWRSSLLIQGATWDWTMEIGRERNYRSHLEASDDGPFTAANGRWQMISNWSPTPLGGTYRIPRQGDPQLNIWPFNWITLKRSQKATSHE